MTEKKYYAVVEFKDGLQVVPNNWLSVDQRSAVWPNFTCNKTYDKAVQSMKNPEPTWPRHPIKKIYGTYFQYAVARKKLKDAEDMSDLNSGTEKEELLKKSRKVRAAKVMDSSASSNEQSDENYFSDFAAIPTFNETITHVSKKQKVQKPARIDVNYTDDENSIIYAKNVGQSATLCKEKIAKKDSQLQKHKNVKVFDGYLDCITSVIDCNTNLDPQCTRNFSHGDELLDETVSIPISSYNCNDKASYYKGDPQFTINFSHAEELLDNEKVSIPMSSYNSNYKGDYYKEDPQCTTSFSNGEQLLDNEKVSIPTSSYNSNYKGGHYKGDPKYSEHLPHNEGQNNVGVKNSLDETAAVYVKFNHEQKNFKHFLIRKIINIESTIHDIKKNVKVISEKLSIDFFDKKEKENIDTLKDFPLKEQNDLNTLEMKLENDAGYGEEMIKQLARLRSGCMKTYCIRLMRFIFSNQLAIKYSWFGAKKKQNFSTLNICKVIMSVIRKAHSDASDDQISAPIKIWLAHSKERIGRQNQNQHENQDEHQDQE